MPVTDYEKVDVYPIDAEEPSEWFTFDSLKMMKDSLFPRL